MGTALMKFEPYIGHPRTEKEGTVGFRCTAEDGSISYVYLNPSDVGEFEEDTDIFVYAGKTGDPTIDGPECYIVPENVPGKIGYVATKPQEA
jgi:hypothetical protein